MNTLLLVIINCPDEDTALTIGRTAIERGHAKAFNVSAPMKTGYIWQGQFTENVEHQLLFKIMDADRASLLALARELHPFEVPSIIALPIEDADPDYRAFVSNRNVG